MLDCVKSKNSYMLLIKIVNFKLCLINFVYIFLRHSEFIYAFVTNKLREQCCVAMCP